MVLSDCLMVSPDGVLIYIGSQGQVYEVIGVNSKTGLILST